MTSDPSLLNDQQGRARVGIWVGKGKVAVSHFFLDKDPSFVEGAVQAACGAVFAGGEGFYHQLADMQCTVCTLAEAFHTLPDVLQTDHDGYL